MRFVKKNAQKMFLMGLCILVGCQSFPTKLSVQDAAEKIIKPFMPAAQLAHRRSIARQPASADSVQVYLSKNRQTKLPKLDYIFTSRGPLAEFEITVLRKYIINFRAQLGDKSSAQKHVELKLLNQIIDGDSRIIRFQQAITRRVGADPYTIDVIGATIIAVIKDNNLVSLNSHLIEVPSLSPVFKNPGIFFDFTDVEMSYFMEVIKLHPDKRANIRKYLEVTIANRTGRKIDFDSILNKSVPEQKVLMNEIYGQLPRAATARMIIDMASRNQLALVNHGGVWMFQVTYYFYMPMQFDIEIPTNSETKLKIKNFREVGTTATEKGFRSPFYPNGNKVENDPAAEVAIKRFKEIQNYFRETMKWDGLNGQSPGLDILIHTNNRTAPFKENAAWINLDKVFVVGMGGAMLGQIDNSLSVLGHEYMHAIIDLSSGLAYKGQSGGLNEHLADIAGASVAADLENSGKFDFTIGADIISSELRAEKEKLLPVIYAEQKFSNEEIENYNLKKIGLRHFFAPSLSLSEQVSEVKQAELRYPASCEPSVNNDNCGVHTVSGIPNKAAALIIAVLGFAETKSLFFRTAVYRMNQTSDFADYVVHLHEECMQMPSIANRCDVIIASFASVGVKYPDGSAAIAAPDGSQVKQNSTPTLAISSKLLISPPIEVCGEINLEIKNQIHIYDDSINPWILLNKNINQTRGEFAGLENSKCACAKGPLSQLVLKNGTIKSFFLNITSWRDQGTNCLQEKVFVKNKKSDKLDDVPEKFCGWVNIDGRTRDVTIIDNTYNAKIFSSIKSANAADLKVAYNNQCVCVLGRIKESRNLNYFEQVNPAGVVPQAIENCSSIHWN